MPKFHIWTAVYTALALPIVYFVLARATRYVADHRDEIGDRLFGAIRALTTESLRNRVGVRRYCNTELNRNASRYLPVPGAADVLHTDDAFVPLKLENAAKRVLSGSEVLWQDGANRIQLVGDPGCGKTSLVKKVFRQACRECVDDPAGEPLPIAVELKSFTPPQRAMSDDALARWGLDQLRRRVDRSADGGTPGIFEYAMANSGLLVLFDGLDEVAAEAYPSVRRALRALSDLLETQNPATRVALTMRSQFYQQVRDEFANEFPRVYHIQPFSPGDIYTFLGNWPYRDGVPAQHTVNRIFTELTDRPTLRDMCSNPLILAMYVASDQGGGDVGAPDTRTSFYSAVVDELLLTRRRRQLAKPLKSTLKTQRERLFGALAFDNLTDASQPANVIPWDHALRAVTEIYGCRTESQAAAQLRDVCKETGLMTEERPGETLRFIHLTFCEFFAAKEAVVGRHDGWAGLIRLHATLSWGPQYGKSRLTEAIPFAVGLTARVRQPDAIEDVRNLDDRLILGRVFLETQAYDHPGWPEYVFAESGYLSGVDQRAWDEGWLRRLHLFAVVMADEAEWRGFHNRPATAATLDTVFADLVHQDRARLLAVFGSYAAVDPQAALRLSASLNIDLAKDYPEIIIRNLSSPPFLSLVLERFAAERPLGVEKAAMLCEAALRESYLALELHWLPHTDLCLGAPDAIPLRDRWFVRDTGRWRFPPQLRLSLLTHLLSVVTHAGSATDPTVCPRVAVLRAVKPPGGQWFTRLLWLRFWMAGAAGVAAAFGGFAMLTQAWRLTEGHAVTAMLSALGTSVVGLVLMQGLAYPRARVDLYSAFLFGTLYGMPQWPVRAAIASLMGLPGASLARWASSGLYTARDAMEATTILEPADAHTAAALTADARPAVPRAASDAAATGRPER